jgi:hypothetical protein
VAVRGLEARQKDGGASSGYCGMGPAAALLVGTMGPVEPFESSSMGSAEHKTGMEHDLVLEARRPWPGAAEPRRVLAGERLSRWPWI